MHEMLHWRNPYNEHDDPAWPDDYLNGTQYYKFFTVQFSEFPYNLLNPTEPNTCLKPYP